VRQDEKGVFAEKPDAALVFAFESPYPFCGVPDPFSRLPPMEGAILSPKFFLPQDTAVEIAMEAGRTRTVLWASAGKIGPAEPRIDYTAHACGLLGFTLTIRFSGRGARMDALRNHLWFMCSPHSLPALKFAGENRMTVHHGDAFGLPTRPQLIEAMFIVPGAEPPKAFASENLLYKPETMARLLPRDPKQPWRLVYELPAPEGEIAWVTAYTLVEGRKPDEAYDGTKATIEFAPSPQGPWKTIGESAIEPDPNGWHFGLFGETGRLPGGLAKGYVRFSAKKGLLGVRLAAHCLPRGATLAAAGCPLEIEHVWFEEDPKTGRRLFSHAETVNTIDHEYAVRCAQVPHNRHVTLRVPSVKK
jgi:hypothetical protein